MAVPTSDLEVRHGAQVVGRLLVGQPAGRLQFAYDATWLARVEAFPVSVSLPLRPGAYDDQRGHTFFANLLPEGAVREAICARLGISRDNDVELLRAIGGECAGALSVVAPDAPLPRAMFTASDYDRLDDRRLQSLVGGKRTLPLLAGGAATRLSLAGAQDKVPVAVLDGRIHLPIGDAPSTHILKLPHGEFAHVPSNEAFVLALGAAIGLDVVNAELTTRTDPPSLLIERYDRVRDLGRWPAVRLHQEDLCQALGLPPTRKYEQEGGPSLVAAVDLVRAQVRQPLVDVARVIEWQAFNVCAGNADGHGKNLSIVYTGSGPRLSPFYDLLATRQYDRLDRRMAMGVGGQHDPDRLGRSHWEAFAAALDINPRTVLGLVTGVAERCADVSAATVKAFRARHGELAVLQTLPRAIVRRAGKLRRALAAG